MIFLFLLVVAIATGQPSPIILSDIQYSIPNCNLGVTSPERDVLNTFGSLVVGNDLMGEGILLHVNLDNTNPSCRLCHISPNYCGAMGGDSNLHLAYDTHYNLKIISGFNVSGGIETPTTSISFSLQNRTYAIVERPDLCGTTLRMVVLVIANIDRPVERDFLLIANQGNKTIPCIKGWGLSDLSCQVSQTYYYVDYEVSNCLAINSSIEPGGGDDPYHYTPFYYYYESVVMNNTEILGDERMLLCGESWLSIYRRVSLKDYCHPYNSLYVKPKAWYEAALLITSYWLNGNRGEDVWLALEALERTCSHRESELQFEDSVFYNLTLWMTEEDSVYDKITICEWIANAGLDTTVSNITLPFFFYHYDEWWYIMYQYILEADESMKVYAYLLTLVFPTVFLVLVVALGVTIYHIRCRPAERYELVQ